MASRKADGRVNGDVNRLSPQDRAAHNWYRFVLSFPPHLVRDYLIEFGADGHSLVLDPFCGTGTTLVECKKRGIPSVGIEANPLACFASQVKVDWSPYPDGLMEHALGVADMAMERLRSQGIEDTPIFVSMPYQGELRSLPPESMKLLLTDSISPLPLHKVLTLLDCLHERRDELYYHHELLALAKALVYSISNLTFGPEVGIGNIKEDAPVVSSWLSEVRVVSQDLRLLQSMQTTKAVAYQADARQQLDMIAPQSVDIVITSPPYPNEKDYTRTTRLESVLLGFIRTRAELQSFKQSLVRSNTRGVYVLDTDHYSIATNSKIQALAKAIEARRVELGKTSGFEKLYAKVTRLYFGGMAEHLASLRRILRPGAHLAYVVGDQASYLRVMIRTGEILGDVAQSLGYEVVRRDLFRTRLATATKEQLREEVLVLRWPGSTLTLANTQREEGSMSSNRYVQIIQHIFFSHYTEGAREIEFERHEFEDAAKALDIPLPKNLGDIIYSFRYRASLPEEMLAKAPEGYTWVIRPAGRGRYRIVAAPPFSIKPNPSMAETKIPDSTPGIIDMYASDDEQALLAKLRYNRLIDTFTGITCYSLQSHMRTALPEGSQVETDEIYVGVDQRGIQYVLPVQAKGANETLGQVQIEQDFALCANRYPSLTCRAIAAQFMEKNLIALFEMEQSESGIGIAKEAHYRLVPPDDISLDDLQTYRRRTPWSG